MTVNKKLKINSVVHSLIFMSWKIINNKFPEWMYQHNKNLKKIEKKYYVSLLWIWINKCMSIVHLTPYGFYCAKINLIKNYFNSKVLL